MALLLLVGAPATGRAGAARNATFRVTAAARHVRTPRGWDGRLLQRGAVGEAPLPRAGGSALLPEAPPADVDGDVGLLGAEALAWQAGR